MAKLHTVKLKQIQQFNTEDNAKLIQSHKNIINLMMRKMGLDIYSVMWVQFFKGFGLGGLAVWLLMR